MGLDRVRRPAANIRRIANEYLENASVGATTVIDGVTLPCGRSP
jgi:hypothetical protein